MSQPQSIQTSDMPKVLGPYSQAVRVDNLLFISGQSGLDPLTGELPGDGFEVQALQAFKNLSAVLQAAGSALQCVAKTTIFLSDANNFPKLNELYAKFFPLNAPARSTPIVQLPRGLLISIECIATIQAETSHE